MENIVLTIGGLIKRISFSDIFFFVSSLILILLLIYIIYLIKTEETEIKNSNNSELPKTKVNNEIASIVNNIEENYEPKHVDLSKYEQEMEDTAIISYEELLKRANSDIAYDDNFKNKSDDLVVKKVDDSNMSKTREYVNLPSAVMMSYENEEAFLEALKTIHNNLVR